MNIPSCFIYGAGGSVQKQTMSYRDFERGLTAEEVRKKKLAGIYEEQAEEELKRWKESERALDYVRSIKAFNEKLDQEVIKRWRQVQRRR